MRKIIIGSLFVASSLFATDTVLAVVNGKSIDTNYMNNLLKAQRVNYNKLPAKTKIKLLDRVITDTLLAQQAKKSKLENSAEYKEGINLLKRQFLIRLFLRKKLDSFKVSDTEIKNFYYKYRDVMFKQPAQIKVRHILVDSKAKADAIINKLRHTPKNKLVQEFAALAKKDSLDTTKAVGGELGWLPKNKLIPSFANAVFRLKPNSFTAQPIKTKFGWHIAYVEGKKPAQYIPLNKVKNRIIQEVKLQKLRDYIAALKNQSNIVYK